MDVVDVIISYDIACKWSIHHLERFSQNHPHLNIDSFHSLTLSPSSISLAMVLHAKWNICLTLPGVLGGLMVKLWNRSGHILTLQLYPHWRWDPVLATSP